jgi:hypothetical protein
MAYAHILESEYYGDQVRWFIGTVVDVNDPLKLDRVKVRVYGIHTSNTIDIPNQDLPWASVLIPVTEGGTSGIGANSQIKNRAQVFGIFLDGKDSQCPLVMGSIPKVETKRNDVNEAPSAKNEYDGSSIVPDSTPQGVKPGVPSVSEGNLRGQNNAEKAYNFFLSKEGGSFTAAQSAGIIGNLIAESGKNLNPTIVSGFKDEGSFGIAQWNPSKAAGFRLQELKRFCKDSNLNFRTLYAQLKFIVYELGKYPYLGLGKLRKAQTPEEASRIFERYYERPAPGSTQKRIAFALEIDKKLGIGAA